MFWFQYLKFIILNHFYIAAPPGDGEANKELIRYIAKLLKLRSSDVSLDKVI